MKACSKCKIDKPLSEFNASSTSCKPCTRSYDTSRRRTFKVQCVRYKGRKCEHCGYDKCLGALEFHHIDPSEKDFSISNATSRKGLTPEIKKELDKCLLLCANCHREEHESLRLG